MKIAAITEDGNTISQHFGRAPYYMVVTVEAGEIVSHELREKLGHVQFEAEGHAHDEDAQGRHGYGPAAQSRHTRMAQAITDCDALLCRGMGMGAYEGMKAHDVRPVITDITDIDEACLAYAHGHIVDHIEQLH